MHNSMIYKQTAIEALSLVASNGVCDLDLAIEVINDLSDVYGNNNFDKHDVVYILKENVDSEEIKYSIRSVVQNLPYNNLVFYCGCPRGIKPDKYFPFTQTGTGKLAKTKSTFVDIMNNENLTENIWLFNDDFFIMKPMQSTLPICNGSLYSVIQKVEKNKQNRSSAYSMKLRDTAIYLHNHELDTISYESHTPMLINRKKALYILQNFPEEIAFRSTYGNYYHIKGQLRPDVKVSFMNQTFDENSDMLSTNDETFANGEIGSYIRSMFPTPCKYELT